MHPALTRCGALLLAGLLFTACRDKHEPVKPTVQQPAATLAAPAR